MVYNSKKDSTIEIIGAIGTAISLIALLQLMMFIARTNWFSIMLIITYLISTLAYILYFKQKPIYIYFLGVAGLLALVGTTLTVTNGTTSLVQIILTGLNISLFIVSFEMKHLAYIKKIDAYKKADI
jgi:hypothetical protein